MSWCCQDEEDAADGGCSWCDNRLWPQRSCAGMATSGDQLEMSHREKMEVGMSWVMQITVKSKTGMSCFSQG